MNKITLQKIGSDETTNMRTKTLYPHQMKYTGEQYVLLVKPPFPFPKDFPIQLIFKGEDPGHGMTLVELEELILHLTGALKYLKTCVPIPLPPQTRG